MSANFRELSCLPLARVAMLRYTILCVLHHHCWTGLGQLLIMLLYPSWHASKPVLVFGWPHNEGGTDPAGAGAASSCSLKSVISCKSGGVTIERLSKESLMDLAAIYLIYIKEAHNLSSGALGPIAVIPSTYQG